MARTIILTTLVVKRIVIDTETQSMTVDFTVHDDTSTFNKHGSAVFYRTTPKNTDGSDRALRDNEFVLTTAQGNQLAQMVVAVRNYLTTRFLD